MAGPGDEDARSWSVPLNASQDVARARRAANAAMAEIGASVIKRTKFVTAVSEVARNALVHGGGGYIQFRIERRQGQPVLVAECVDRGPGIDDIERALADGYSGGGGGLGHGLGGARRLVDRFQVRSSARLGTTVRLECAAR